MPTFTYVAKDAAGETISGRMDADAQRAVIEALHKQALIVLEVQLAKGSKLTGRGGQPKLGDLAIFSRQLATLIKAGIPLLEALSILADQMDKKSMRVILAQVKIAVETGASFSEALAKHPKLFSTLYVSMVRAGEAGGHLDEILARVATYLEKMQSLQRKIKTAMVYPCLVIVTASAITTFLIVKIIPTFKEIFATLDVTLPLPTLIVIGISDFLRMNLAWMMVTAVVGGFGLTRFINTPGGRIWWDRFQLKWPLFGMLFRKVAIARFSRTLSTLIKSGVPILVALEIVGKTAGNKVVEAAVMQVRTSIKEGERIAVPLEASGVFPPLVTRMIAIGEETGALEEMLAKIADFYDEQVEALVAGLTSILEPAMIIILGVVIGGIVISMFLPIFKLMGAISGPH